MSRKKKHTRALDAERILSPCTCRRLPLLYCHHLALSLVSFMAVVVVVVDMAVMA